MNEQQIKMPQESWIEVSSESDFSLANIPFGVFRTDQLSPRCCTAIGPFVVDLAVLAENRLLGNGAPADIFHRNHLNDFIHLGKAATNAIRLRLIELFSQGNHELQDRQDLQQAAFHKHDDVRMLMPVHVGDYTDFYSSKEHATNVGSLFRDPDNALLPNWKHLPVAYHGRASSIVVSGTPIIRPKGQTKRKEESSPVFGPTQALDFELEMAFVIGKDSRLGESISVKNAEEYIFGFVLFNDWSARDIQSWEYVPLGPFLAKNFASSVSPWIVTLEALAPFKTKGPSQDVPVLPYLQFEGAQNYDVNLTVELQPATGVTECISHSNSKYLYWNFRQQLAHHTVNGCNIRVGDMMASGTISGPARESLGSLLEITRNGKEPITLKDKSIRRFLEDGDTVIIKGYAERDKVRVGFGDVTGKVKPAQ